MSKVFGKPADEDEVNKNLCVNMHNEIKPELFNTEEVEDFHEINYYRVKARMNAIICIEEERNRAVERAKELAQEQMSPYPRSLGKRKSLNK